MTENLKEIVPETSDPDPENPVISNHNLDPDDPYTQHSGPDDPYTHADPDPGVAEGPVTQTVITHNASYQADDLDAYDSDCDDFSTTKAVLMANLSSYGSDVLSKIKLMLYDGSVIAKETSVISITDFKETLMLEEESRSKMLLNQSNLKVLEKKVNIKPINYAELN
nr:hypothetical protein [Tanacetum cinerariifolium]